MVGCASLWGEGLVAALRTLSRCFLSLPSSLQPENCLDVAYPAASSASGSPRSTPSCTWVTRRAVRWVLVL